MANFLFRAIRTPKPEQIAESVTIPRTRTKRQYYVIDRQNRRVPLYTEGSTLQPYEFAYSLAIEKGSVSLYDQIKTTSGYSSMAITWRGFLISTGNDKGDFSGTIQFTNTPAFFNTVDGRVTIEKSGDTITITAVSTEYIEEELRKFYSIEPPVHLVLEF
ncbi:MAG: hypothetical protein LBU00_08280 [Treponema sp.]|nr:hypothetical protein [Treponema sp.]